MQIYCQLTAKYAFRDKTCHLNIAACTANCAEEIFFYSDIYFKEE